MKFQNTENMITAKENILLCPYQTYKGTFNMYRKRFYLIPLANSKLCGILSLPLWGYKSYHVPIYELLK